MGAPATLSTEGKVIANLSALKMTRKDLVGICNHLSVPISESLLSMCLSGRREFSQWTGMNLLSVLGELRALMDHHGVALQWTDSAAIATEVVRRRMESVEESNEVMS